MENKYFKYLLIVLLIIFVVPQIALAAWWNPFTWNWNIFDWFSKPQNSYVQDFTTGKSILYYNASGIFQVDIKTNQTSQLVNSNVMNAGLAPVLSPDNTKIAFYTSAGIAYQSSAGTINNQYKYDLWMYDLTNKKLQKLLTDVVGMGTQPLPVWAKNSKSIFITSFESDAYGNYSDYSKLYSVNLAGLKSQVEQSYLEDVQLVQVLNDNFLSLVDSKHGLIVLNLKNNEVFPLNPGDGDLITFKKINNNTFLEIITSSIGGLQKLDLLNGQETKFPPPSGINIGTVQPIIYCGGRVLLGQVNSAEEYNGFYTFNPVNNSVQSIKISDEGQPLSISSGIASGLQCDVNSNVSKFYFQNNSTYPSMTALDLSNPSKTQIIDYSDILPQNIKAGITNDCITTSLVLSSFANGDNSTYFQLDGPNSLAPLQQCTSGILSLVGIYRLNKKDNLFSKVGNSDDQSFLMPPNF